MPWNADVMVGALVAILKLAEEGKMLIVVEWNLEQSMCS